MLSGNPVYAFEKGETGFVTYLTQKCNIVENLGCFSLQDFTLSSNKLHRRSLPLNVSPSNLDLFECVLDICCEI